MRRHPNRLSPKKARELQVAMPEQATIKRRPYKDSKRGPKDRRRLWPTLKYIIVKGHGVLFLEPKA